MTEREMEDLLWEHSADLLGEHLEPFRRQHRSQVGRADLIFEDRFGGLLIIELKRGSLTREAIHQLFDYYGTMKAEFPDRPVDLMVVANHIPRERKLACETHDVNWKEISEKSFRDVARRFAYVFRSELPSISATEAAEDQVANVIDRVESGRVGRKGRVKSDPVVHDSREQIQIARVQSILNDYVYRPFDPTLQRYMVNEGMHRDRVIQWSYLSKRLLQKPVFGSSTALRRAIDLTIANRTLTSLSQAQIMSRYSYTGKAYFITAVRKLG
jgi:hypothetical protein